MAIAVEYGSYIDTGRGAGGNEDDHGKFVTVYRKVNGTWKVSADISNSTKPKEDLKSSAYSNIPLMTYILNKKGEFIANS